MRIFFDTKWHDTALISIGCIAEDGRTFYAECTDYDKAQAQAADWLKENVIAHLKWPEPTAEDVEAHFCFAQYPQHVEGLGTREKVRAFLRDWLAEFGQVEMWKDCLAYDWYNLMLFCELFGDVSSIPPFVHYVSFDLVALLQAKGIDPDAIREGFPAMGDEAQKHDALWNARTIKAYYDKAIVMPDEEEVALLRPL
jgi:hypothetical protein